MNSIRYEITNNINPNLNWGVFTFPIELLDTSQLTKDEVSMYNELLSAFKEPDVFEGLECEFYFTEKGYMKYQFIIDTIRKCLLPIFEISEKYLIIEKDDKRIVYLDEYQIAIKNKEE